jgi:hypothetical protein
MAAVDTADLGAGTLDLGAEGMLELAADGMAARSTAANSTAVRSRIGAIFMAGAFSAHS